MMDVKTKLAVLALLVGACGDDAKPAPEDSDEEEAEVADSGRRDAGRDASRDAGRDARGDDQEEPTEEEPSEEEPVVDAGRADASRSDASADAGRSDAGSSATDCDAVSYEAFAGEFIQTYCLSCHGAMDPTFNDLDEITPHLDEIRERVLDTTNTALRMPPRSADQPTAAEKAKLKQWLDCGGE